MEKLSSVVGRVMVPKDAHSQIPADSASRLQQRGAETGEEAEFTHQLKLKHRGSGSWLVLWLHHHLGCPHAKSGPSSVPKASCLLTRMLGGSS